MRKLILIVVMFISPTLVAPTIPVDSVEIIKTEPTISEHDQFLNDIGFRESGNRYTIVNEFGSKCCFTKLILTHITKFIYN